MATAAPENRATVERGSFDGEATWILTHPDGARLVVAETGATLLAWQVPGPDGRPMDLLDGYTSAALPQSCLLATRDPSANARSLAHAS